jgi:hypothetical protein
MGKPEIDVRSLPEYGEVCRLLRTVKPNTEECLNWPYRLNSEGRGIFKRGREWEVHRLAYEIELGRPIPPRQFVVQTCGNLTCFRPSHLHSSPFEIEVLREKTKDPGDDCIDWPFHKDKKGRGYVWVKLPTGAPHRRGKKRIAARVAYEEGKGLIPPGKLICHTCDNPSCINPNHLYPGTVRDNNRDCNMRERRNQCVGERHPNHKLTDEEAREIYRLRSEGRKLRELAEQFKVSKGLISQYFRGKKRRHLQLQGAAVT